MTLLRSVGVAALFLTTVALPRASAETPEGSAGSSPNSTLVPDSKGHDLSHIRYTGEADHTHDRVVVLVSKWNSEITEVLYEGNHPHGRADLDGSWE